MGASVGDRAPPRRPALIEPGKNLAALLDELAARMSPEQRVAFLAKMAAMNRQQQLSAAAITLGRA